VVPVAAFALREVPDPAHHAAPRALGRAYEAVMAGLPDRMVASAQRLHTGLEAASSGKVAAVAMSATALGGGVAAVDGPPSGAHRAVHRPGPTAHVRVAPARATVAAAAVSGGADAATDDAPASPSRARSAMPPPSPASRAGRGRGAPEFGFEGGDSSRPATQGATAPAAGTEFGGGGGGAVAAADATPAAGGAFGP
jgi:hypothetical protein